MSFTYLLRHEDGSPADPPTFRSAVPTWRPGDVIPLGRRTLHVTARQEPDDPNGHPVLIVAEY